MQRLSIERRKIISIKKDGSLNDAKVVELHRRLTVTG
jgi:hypothetical protein